MTLGKPFPLSPILKKGGANMLQELQDGIRNYKMYFGDINAIQM